MTNFDKKIFINNIYYLAKEQDIKIGFLEEKVGVSTGYFSRLLKDDSNYNPGINIIVAVSNYLNVSVDSLLKIDFTQNGFLKTEYYILMFVEKLLEKTKRQEINWEKDSINEIKNLKVKFYSKNNSRTRIPYYEHPLFEPTIKEFKKYDLTYKSLFTDAYMYVNDDIFHFKDEDNTYYLTKVYCNDSEKEDISYEVYLLKNNHRKKICNTSKDTKQILKESLAVLYETVDNYCNFLKIDDDVKEAIDSFMKEKV